MKEKKVLPRLNSVCPQCKTKRLAMRKSQFGTFLGCNAFPECKFSTKAFMVFSRQLQEWVKYKPKLTKEQEERKQWAEIMRKRRAKTKVPFIRVDLTVND